MVENYKILRYTITVCTKKCTLRGRRNFELQLTTSRTQGGMSRGKESRKNC